ncbi:hypothetical protein PUNSTDRAFT_138953 [Punctularia strigosozonata HHB-11173 SS5]|uniref:Uncharacterized protein n=1 Tax=Punctularia strigosozonata (strain HHB-11173) TaxID=741275 RepID=R7S386_PUNST|nr:uncharacterized protein PUNSTDRAFT_138953 [Punctularia strigosozonata HHB-11173 SS5]EIN04227.1 hypothetical protein PUNSTDRAFT_138953 [Punctularia strigosozonata HHB-11173 SS5]
MIGNGPTFRGLYAIRVELRRRACLTGNPRVGPLGDFAVAAWLLGHAARFYQLACSPLKASLIQVVTSSAHSSPSPVPSTQFGLTWLCPAALIHPTFFPCTLFSPSSNDFLNISQLRQNAAGSFSASTISISGSSPICSSYSFRNSASGSRVSTSTVTGTSVLRALDRERELGP